MNVSDQIDELKKELKEIESRTEADHLRAKVIKSTIGKLNTQAKKIDKILSESKGLNDLVDDFLKEKSVTE